MPSSKPTLYTSSPLGYVALFAAFLLVAIPFAHFFGGPSEFRNLRVVSGKVLGIEVLELPRGSREISLEVALQGGGLERFKYGSSRGESVGVALEQLSNRQVQLWVDPDSINNILQLEADGKRIVDYAVRSAEMRGNPIGLAIYWVIALGVFVGITKVRRQALRALAPNDA